MRTYKIKFVGVSHEHIPTLIDELFNQGTFLSIYARNSITNVDRQRIEWGEPVEIEFRGNWIGYHQEVEKLSRELNCSIVLSIYFTSGGVRLVFDAGRCINTYLI